MNKYAESLLPYVNNPNVRKVLDFISTAEGADYDTGFGGAKISLDKHPNETKYFRNKEGKRLPTTAAGRYQFIGSTYRSLSNRLGLNDFSPASQDLAAVELIKEKGALDDIVKGDITTAIKKLNTTWASLPDSPHKQRTVSWDFAANFFGGGGGSRQGTAGQAAPATASIADLIAAMGNEGYTVPVQQQQVAQQPAVAQTVPSNTIYDTFGAVSTAPDSGELFATLFSTDIEDAANDARNAAVEQFISGGTVDNIAPSLVMPKPLAKEIDNIISGL